MVRSYTSDLINELTSSVIACSHIAESDASRAARTVVGIACFTLPRAAQASGEEVEGRPEIEKRKVSDQEGAPLPDLVLCWVDRGMKVDDVCGIERGGLIDSEEAAATTSGRKEGTTRSR